MGYKELTTTAQIDEFEEKINEVFSSLLDTLRDKLKRGNYRTLISSPEETIKFPIPSKEEISELSFDTLTDRHFKFEMKEYIDGKTASGEEIKIFYCYLSFPNYNKPGEDHSYYYRIMKLLFPEDFTLTHHMRLSGDSYDEAYLKATYLLTNRVLDLYKRLS